MRESSPVDRRSLSGQDESKFVQILTAYDVRNIDGLRDDSEAVYGSSYVC